MQVIKKEQKVFEAKQFDATRLPTYWPKGVIYHPGSGWFLQTENEEVGVSNGDWIVGGAVFSPEEFDELFVDKKAVDKEQEKNIALQILGAKVIQDKEKKKSSTKKEKPE